jgi:hypothetical protein
VLLLYLLTAGIAVNSKQGYVEYNIIAKKFEEEQRATLGSLLFDFERVGEINQNIEHIPL